MERLLHYTWEHKLFAAGTLLTTTGQVVNVIDPGLLNFNAGPDFLNAKIRINNELWVGNVEIHNVSSDWMRHGHQHDANYNNVILHVVSKVDADVYTADGKLLPQLVIQVPDNVKENYAELLGEDKYPPCWKIIPTLPPVLVHQWLDRLCVERLEQKIQRIFGYVDKLSGDWENAFFVTLARSFGFGLNSDAFEEWALNMSLNACGKHRDNLFQIEALFLGQAGLLDGNMIPSYHRASAMEEGYFSKLQSEYQFLSHKFSLKAMNGMNWNFFRLRPYNFPYVRIVQLAQLYYSCQVSLSAITDVSSLEEAYKILDTRVTPYWTTHCSFGVVSGFSEKRLQRKSLDLILINALVPMLFAYGRHRMKEDYCQKALRILAAIKPEDNRYTRLWTQTGMPVSTASDTQALIQLRTRYCDLKDCLRCWFGCYYLKRVSDK